MNEAVGMPERKPPVAWFISLSGSFPHHSLLSTSKHGQKAQEYADVQGSCTGKQRKQVGSSRLDFMDF